MVNKRIVMIGAIGGMTIGVFAPMLWGDYNSFGMVSILMGMIGGLAGIWVGVKASKLGW